MYRYDEIVSYFLENGKFIKISHLGYDIAQSE